MSQPASGNRPFFDWPDPDTPAREVWYSLVSHPDQPVAFWYRYTLVMTADGGEARVWAALTDDRPDGLEDVFITERFEPGSATIGDPFALSIGTKSRLTDAEATGRVVSETHEVEWSLSYEPDDLTFTPVRDEDQMLEWARQLDTGVHWSANQSVAMEGTVTVDGTDIELSNAPGHQGHTAGPSAPDDWVWTHCNAFEDGDVALEVLSSDGRITPACLRLPEGDFLLNRQDQVLGETLETLENEPGRWRFRAETDEVAFEATVEADTDHWQLASYLTPDSSLRYNAHCSLAAVSLTINSGSGERTYTSDAGRVEWVSREPPVPGSYPPFEG